MRKNKEIEHIIQQLTPVFQKYNIKKAILFGSYAQGKATSVSDIDLLVDSGLKGLQFVGLIEEIRRATEKDVDLLDVSHVDKESPIDLLISKEGIVIYDNPQAN